MASDPKIATGTEAARNAQTVGAIYAAFGRGDIPAILATLSDDVAWEWGYPHNGDIPWFRPGRGRDQAAQFFATIQDFTFQRFDVVEIMSSGDWVVAITTVELTWIPTGGKIVEPCEPHVWRFDAAGQVVSFRHASDTRQHAVAAGLGVRPAVQAA